MFTPIAHHCFALLTVFLNYFLHKNKEPIEMTAAMVIGHGC